MIPLHPKIVHFPVALLITATVFGILALVFKSKRNIFKEVLIWNLALGVAGTIVAIISGLLEEKNLLHNDTIHSIMETHELLGFIFSGIFFALLIWMIVRKLKMKTPEFVSVVVLLIFSSVLLGYSAHLGGKMVYKEGAGVIPMESNISHEEHDHNHADEEKDSNSEHAVNDTTNTPHDHSPQPKEDAEDTDHEHDHDSHDH